MKVRYKKKFLKQLAALPVRTRSQIETFVFEVLPEIESLAEAGKIEKMTGFKDCYKIRFGSYRVEMEKEKNGVILKAVMHRSEIYRHFP